MVGFSGFSLYINISCVRAIDLSKRTVSKRVYNFFGGCAVTVCCKTEP